jgi:hypothetical protein
LEQVADDVAVGEVFDFFFVDVGDVFDVIFFFFDGVDVIFDFVEF